jgi:hypothetical protein
MSRYARFARCLIWLNWKRSRTGADVPTAETADKSAKIGSPFFYTVKQASRWKILEKQDI